MKVGLIYCGIGVAGFNPRRASGDREGGWISHGLASVGSATIMAGHEVDLIDLRHLSGWEEFGEVIKKNPAEVYGLSVSPVDYATALQAVYEIKINVPEVKIIIGGIHPTIFPEKYEYNVIDTVVRGEGEITFPRLLKDIDNLPKVVRGEKPNLDDLTWVTRELFDYKRELACTFAPDHHTPSVTMLAGRGCPYKCAYCQPAENSVFGKPHRMRSVYDVIDELWWLYEKYRFRSVTFWDDTFTFNRPWIEKFCELYQFKAPIAACSRADIICGNEAMIEKMAKAGVDWLVIGLETGSQRLLDFISKGTTVKQNREAVRICHKYGIKVFATIMFGLPTETKEESDMTDRMVAEIGPNLTSPFWYVPIPGTRLYEYCEKNNLLLHDMDGETIARTGKFVPQIKGVDYDHLKGIMEKRNVNYAYQNESVS